MKIKEEIFCLRADIKDLARTELAQCCSTLTSKNLLAKLKEISLTVLITVIEANLMAFSMNLFSGSLTFKLLCGGKNPVLSGTWNWTNK